MSLEVKFKALTVPIDEELYIAHFQVLRFFYSLAVTFKCKFRDV